MKSSLSSNAFSRNPLFVLAAAFAIGICFETVLEVDWRFPVLIFSAAAAASVFSKKARTALVLSGFVCAGVLAGWVEAGRLPSNALARLYDDRWIDSGDPVEIDGFLSDQPRTAQGGFVIDASVTRIVYKRETIPTDGQVRLFVNSSNVNECVTGSLRAGNRVGISVRLKREEPFRNPGMRSYIEALDQKGFAATGFVKSCLLIELLDSGRSWPAPFFEFREWITRRILITQDPRSAGIILASLVGNRGFLTRESGETFRENGTFHVLVISGLHITLIGGLLLALFSKLTRNRVWQFVASNTLLWVYALIVGLQVPVLRAALMYTVFLLAYTIHARLNPVNSLGAACLAVLVWRPLDLLNPSFQLTFLSVFAIVGFAFPVIQKLREAGSWVPSPTRPFPPTVCRPLRLFSEALYWSQKRWDDYRSRQYWNCEIKKTRVGEYLADGSLQKAVRTAFELVFVTVSVQMFTLPLLVVLFHRLSAGSLVSNLFAGIAVLALNASALITILISLIDIESAVAFSGVASYVNVLAHAAQDAVSWGLVKPLRLPVYAGTAAAVYFLYFIPLMGVAYSALRFDPFKKGSNAKRLIRRSSCLFLAVLAVVIIWHPYSGPDPDGRLTVDFLDVGQGDAALVTFPNGQTMLVDGGGRREFEDAEGEPFDRDRIRIGESVVSEFLWEKGYPGLDFVLSTHPDADHIEGLREVVENFPVGAVMTGGEFDGEPGFDLLRAAAVRNGVPFLIVGEGLEVKIGGAKATFLNPPAGRVAGPGNGDSVVVRIELGTRSFLLTGDIEAETETRMISSGLLLPADIVKAPHHGSRTSSTPEFVKRMSAEYVVVPVGRRSPYGHPHREVLDRWKASGARVMIVGSNGTVTVSTDGKDLRLNWFHEI